MKWERERNKFRNMLGEDKIKNMRRFIKEDMKNKIPPKINLITVDNQILTHTTPKQLEDTCKATLAIIDSKDEKSYIKAVKKCLTALDNP